MLSRNQIILISSVAAIAVGAGVYMAVSNKPAPRPESVQAVMPVELTRAIAEAKTKPGKNPAAMLASASASQTEMNFERGGINTLKLRVTNSTKQPFSVSLGAGTIFQNDRSELLLLKPFESQVQPGATLQQDLSVVALSSRGQSEHGTFTSSTKTQPKLAGLIQHLESHSSVPVTVAQTAALAILEDAPAGLFAKFPRPLADDVSETETFRVETSDMVAAAQLLREIGVDSAKFAQDAQLKVEAMVDLKAHDLAMQYYGISHENEWAYWKGLLTEGDPTMRHYGLYGIARYYPDVAVQMMPKWALEVRTAPHYRKAAIGALALTQKSEAKPLLEALERDLSKETELAQRVDPALRYLEQHLPNAL